VVNIETSKFYQYHKRNINVQYKDKFSTKQSDSNVKIKRTNQNVFVPYYSSKYRNLAAFYSTAYEKLQATKFLFFKA
jgi:hypothetical protein